MSYGLSYAVLLTFLEDDDMGLHIPFFGMMCLTFVVWSVLYINRLYCMLVLKRNLFQSSTPELMKEHVPSHLHTPTYNLHNLFELPVLFYAICLYLMYVDQVDSLYVMSAYVFFVFRVIHSLIHCTINQVFLRLTSYLIASFALWFMLVRILLSLIEFA
ncbi:MAG: MAPEG family protein [Pseudomonadota bacterium]